mgnify:CR=1 FL=1
MAARALHEFTDGLPLVTVTDVPDVLERSTEGAIRFGLTWGAVGAVRNPAWVLLALAAAVPGVALSLVALQV